MVSNNIKSHFMPKETRCFLENENYSKTPKSNFKIWLLTLPLLIILISSFVLSIYSFIKIQTYNEEVESLKKEIKKLKLLWVDDDLFDNIKQFENEDLYPDDSTEERTTQPWLMNGGDDLDLDYDLNYEDEDDEPTDKIHRFIEDEITDVNNNDYSPDHEDIPSLLKGGSFTKIGKETQRSKRDVVASTFDGVPINEESYADMKKKNKTRKQDSLRLYDYLKPVGGDGVYSPIPNLESSYQSPAWLNKHHSTHGLTHYEQLEMKNPTPAPAPVVSRRSRVMHVEDKSKAFRRVVKKPQLKSGSQWETVEEQIGGPTIIRDDQHHRRNRHRQRNNLETLDTPRAGRMRALPAIQFSGDTSKYVYGLHTNYNGNGHLRHPNRTYVDWVADDWVKSLGMDQHFQMRDGSIKIQESGLYFVYAQIYYLDEHDTNGYHIYKNQQVLLQCTTMTHSNDRVSKSNTCYTAGVDYLVEGDQISVRDLSDGRYSLFETGKSFFGVVKLGEVRIK
ncbi:hypothetical protein ILUMI_24198 [Ignelater luminosus]|uniref:THD domain-containing protein n=1 Tax=Ignelater luminosus TaxID=2038154 RepID=A0A8K0FWN3_IGNLU|nr:hypothetical protein ILUMI_24198 [Ignelater luminosus]